MNTDLTPQQIEQYREQGFLKVAGFLEAPEVDRLKRAVLEACASMGKDKVAGLKPDESTMKAGESYYDRVFTQRLNLWRINDTIKGFMLSPELGRMLCELAGVPGMRVWHDQTLIKEPFANPTAWHLDNPYWSFHSPNAISIWIALEEATLANGCMWFSPGSHRLATYDNAPIGQDMAALFKVYPEMAKIDPISVPMQPGDCSFHNGLTAHAAGPNMTRGRRIAMTCADMPDGCTFNGQKNILPKSYAETLTVGDPLDSDELNPRMSP
jgi:ectoine hydroxylase-related dioxygenase (phytanoyl-CoA dioxygenase family)